MTVLAAHAWNTNADMLADCHRLGYINDDDIVLDPTYGTGLWWSVYRPKNLIAHDKYTLDGVDFRDLPEDDNSVDVVAFDPPYVAKGGRATSGIKEMDARYGMRDCPPTPASLQELMNDGLCEMWRVVRRNGIVLAKCMDYISSGKLWMGTYLTTAEALRIGFTVTDRLELIGEGGPQPKGRRQVHARRNHSTLLVLRKPPRKETA